VAVLAGCGGSQPLIGAPGLMPQTSAFGTHAHRGKSWMLPEASREALLYVVDIGGDIYVVSYPAGKLVGTLTGIDGPQGICSDKNGNVFITAFWTENVLEYAHGGTQPIANLGDYGYYPNGCAVDPTTGNLAVANQASMGGSGGDVAIYTGAKGKPTDYAAGDALWCAYDDQGDLFVDDGGDGIAELSYGSQTFANIALDVAGEGLQWDGKYLALVSPASKVVYRVAISGSVGTVVGTVDFKGLIATLGYDFAIQAGKIIMPFGIKENHISIIGLWDYPRGGRVGKKVPVIKEGRYYSITLSN
jgi:DNA-binding beta-propeller fold protein YncE